MAWSLFSGEPMGGVTPASWAKSVLKAGGWPQTKANIQSLIAWALNEGGGGQYNPLNTTLSQPGATDFNSVGVKNYSSWSEGVAATVATLKDSPGDYGSITLALDEGSGLGQGSYPGLSTWSGGGYDNVSGTWDSAAQYVSGGGSAISAKGAAGSSGGSSSGGADLWTEVQDTWSFLFGSEQNAVTGPVASAAESDISKAGSTALAIVGLTAPFVKIADALDWFFHPNHWIRIFCGIGGGILLGMGAWSMTRVGRSAGTVGGEVAGVPVGVSLPDATLPMAIGLTGLGLLLLFVAFHNLPDSVDSFGAFGSYLANEIRNPSQVNVNG